MASKVFRPSFWYWDRQSHSQTNHPHRVGTVVILGWMLSSPKHLASYARLFKSCGWDSLVCHPQVFNLFFPSRATILALSVLEALAEDLEKHPGPVVFAVFSGGHKACLYKILQVLLGTCDGVQVNEEKFDVVKRSLAGLMFDSSPVDFISELGAKFVSHQVLTLQPGKPITIVSWGAFAVGKGLDAIFGGTLEPQRIDLWRTLYSCVNIGPILFLCSENDELAPVETIRIFASNLKNLGGNVNIVSWKESEHVGHLRLHREQYSTAVRKLLTEVASEYFGRVENSMDHPSVLSAEEFGRRKSAVAAVDRSAAWTDLPESIATEIKRVSGLPHVQSRKVDKAPRRKCVFPYANNAYHDIENQSSSQSAAELQGSFTDGNGVILSRL